MNGLEAILDHTKDLMAAAFGDSMLVDDSHKPFPDRVVVKAFHKTFLAESPQVRRELLQSVINLIHEKTEVTMLFQDLIMQVDSDQTFPLVDCQLRYLTDEGKLQVGRCADPPIPSRKSHT